MGIHFHAKTNAAAEKMLGNIKYFRTFALLHECGLGEKGNAQNRKHGVWDLNPRPFESESKALPLRQPRDIVKEMVYYNEKD